MRGTGGCRLPDFGPHSSGLGQPPVPDCDLVSHLSPEAMWGTRSGLVVMGLPSNWKVSGCRADMDEGLQS